jgi:hypothetical protein
MYADWLTSTQAVDRILPRVHGTREPTADWVAISWAAIRSSEALLQRSDLGTRLPGFNLNTIQSLPNFIVRPTRSAHASHEGSQRWMTARSHSHQIVARMENDICARELALISILATGEDGATERAAIDNMYETLRVTMQGLGMRLPKVDFH